jgi:hypothetical protein
MTKKQMIATIQQQEAKLFLQIKLDEKMFGTSHFITSRSRTEWIGVHDLMRTLEIQPDIDLPDAKEAFKLIREERIDKDKAA